MSKSRQPGDPASASHIRWLLLPLALLAYTIFSFLCMLWFSHQVPLSESDSAAIAIFGNDGIMQANLFPVLGLLLLMFGLPLAFRKETVIGMTLCWLLGFAMLGATGSQFTNNSLKRIAVLDGNARIGCFVEDSRECYEHLGVSDEFPDARSQGRHGNLVPWAKLKLKGTPDTPTAYFLPGFLLIQAPFYAGRGAELTEKLAVQRKDTERYRAELATRVAKAPRYAAEVAGDSGFIPAHPRTKPVRLKVTKTPVLGTPEGVNAKARVMLGTLNNCEASGDAFADLGRGRVFVSMTSLQCDGATPNEQKVVAPLVGDLRDPQKLNRSEIFASSGLPGIFGEPSTQENPPRDGLKLAAGAKATLLLE